MYVPVWYSLLLVMLFSFKKEKAPYMRGFVEYSSKCRRKLLKILARIQSSPGTLNVQRVFSDSFLQEIQRSSIFVFPSDVWRVTKESYGDHIGPSSVFAPRVAASGGAHGPKLILYSPRAERPPEVHFVSNSIVYSPRAERPPEVPTV